MTVILILFKIRNTGDWAQPISVLKKVEEYKKIALIDRNQLVGFVKLISFLMKICNFMHKNPHMKKEASVEYVLNGILLNLYLH